MDADDDWELSPERAHPAARTALAEPFYWSHIDDHAPFGNDMGSDVLSFYRRWRAEYPTAPILHFLRDCLWPSELLDDQEGEIVFEILLHSMHGNPQKILRHDQALIALTFGQFVIEGCINPMLKAHALRAL